MDEPAPRKLLPLRHADGEAYLDSATWAFRWPPPERRMPPRFTPHMCYSEIGEIISAVAAWTRTCPAWRRHGPGWS
ncbi:MAG TPA: hypothetical protein VIE45_09165 [Streptosporangiaceae bacterium]